MSSQCPHCNEQTLVTVQPGQDPRVHCTNEACGGWFATLPRSEFEAMTADDLAARLATHASVKSHDVGLAEFEARVARHMEILAEREAARKPDEKTFC